MLAFLNLPHDALIERALACCGDRNALVRKFQRTANISKVGLCMIHTVATELDIVAGLVFMLHGIGMFSITQEELEPRIKPRGKLGRLRHESGIRGTIIESCQNKCGSFHDVTVDTRLSSQSAPRRSVGR